MQLFRSEDDVGLHQSAGHVPSGAVFDPETLWRLAKLWYNDRLESPWERKSAAARREILRTVGLVGGFWNL